MPFRRFRGRRRFKRRRNGRFKRRGRRVRFRFRRGRRGSTLKKIIRTLRIRRPERKRDYFGAQPQFIFTYRPYLQDIQAGLGISNQSGFQLFSGIALGSSRSQRQGNYITPRGLDIRFGVDANFNANLVPINIESEWVDPTADNIAIRRNLIRDYMIVIFRIRQQWDAGSETFDLSNIFDFTVSGNTAFNFLAPRLEFPDFKYDILFMKKYRLGRPQPTFGVFTAGGVVNPGEEYPTSWTIQDPTRPFYRWHRIRIKLNATKQIQYLLATGDGPIRNQIGMFVLGCNQSGNSDQGHNPRVDNVVVKSYYTDPQ